MATLQLLPEVSGYTTEENGAAWKSVPLPGGLPRTRRDFIDPDVKVSVTWFCNAAEYNYLQQFYAANVARDYERFTIKLILNSSAPTDYQARFVKGTFKLNQQRGNGYWIGATLVVTMARNAVAWPALPVRPPTLYQPPAPILDPLKQEDPWISSKPYPLMTEDAFAVGKPTVVKISAYDPEVDKAIAAPSLTTLLIKDIVFSYNYPIGENVKSLLVLQSLQIKDVLQTYNWNGSELVRSTAPQFLTLTIKDVLNTYNNWPDTNERLTANKPQLLSLVIS